MAAGPPKHDPLGLQLARTAREVSRAFDAALVRVGGSLPTWLILVSIQGRRHGAQREIAEAIGIEGPTLTHHLNRMERDGLLTRTRDPENRRVHQVELTTAGEETFFRLLTEVRTFDARLRRGLSKEDEGNLERLFGLLRGNVAPPKDGPLPKGPGSPPAPKSKAGPSKEGTGRRQT